MILWNCTKIDEDGEIKDPCTKCDLISLSCTMIESMMEWRYPCTECEFIASSASILRENTKRLRGHIEIVHEKIRSPCDKCNHAATSVRKLRLHMDSTNLKVHIEYKH